VGSAFVNSVSDQTEQDHACNDHQSDKKRPKTVHGTSEAWDEHGTDEDHSEELGYVKGNVAILASTRHRQWTSSRIDAVGGTVAGYGRKGCCSDRWRAPELRSLACPGPTMIWEVRHQMRM
jgi:hypothetical protein